MKETISRLVSSDWPAFGVHTTREELLSLDPIRPIYRRSTLVPAGHEMARPDTGILVNYDSVKHSGSIVRAIYHVRVPNNTVHFLKNKHGDDTICYIEHRRCRARGPCSHLLLVLWLPLSVELVKFKVTCRSTNLRCRGH
jgi:hypothetical protein